MRNKGSRKDFADMLANAMRLICAVSALGLAACNDAGTGANKTEQSSSARISAALDVCAQPHDEFAQRVCANQRLAALDRQVRTALISEAADVSDAGAALLVQNQTRWRNAQQVACGITDADAQPTAEQQACLEGRFRARVAESRNAVQQIGGYTFQRMELVDAAPVAGARMAAPSGAETTPAVERYIYFPRIDGPQTPQIRRFNELVAQEPQFRLEDATSEATDYTITYAGPELISVRFNALQETYGAANVNHIVKAVTVLMTEGRPLAAEDVFQANSHWQDFITDRAVADIQRQLPDYPRPPRRDVYETATKAHLWLVTERGLELLFPPLSVGGWSQADPPEGLEVTIPWADLRPYLNPAAPAPIRPSA
jgi:uncharacterized protein